MKTHFQTIKESEQARKWFLVDAEEQIVGRIASRIASILRGKNNPLFSPHCDGGDFVVVVNAEKVKFTGNKWEKKIYYRHSGYVNGIKAETAGNILTRKPERILTLAVQRMLPKSPLGRKQLKKLKIYSGSSHPHSAQQPIPLSVQ